MKKNIVLIIAIVVSILNCKAQEKLRVSINKTRKAHYITYNIGHIGSISKDYHSIWNKNNKLYKDTLITPTRIHSAYSDIIRDALIFPNELLYTIIRESLSREKINKIKGEPTFYLSFYLNDEGKVLEVSYYLSKNSKLTLYDLEKIEINLKQKLLVKFKNDLVKGYNYLPIFISVEPARI